MNTHTLLHSLATAICLFFFTHSSSALGLGWQPPADTLRITTSDSTELFVTVRGQGIPCLYIHGGPGVGSYWMEQLYGEVLENYFTMIYLDQRGSGRSGSASGGDYSIDRLSRDFEEVRQRLNIDAWITFSHSFGGILQINHATKYRETLLGMLMVAPTLSLNESIRDMIDEALVMLEIPEAERAPYLDENKYPLDRLMPLFGIAREREVFWKFHYADPSNYVRMDSVMGQVNNPNFEFSKRSFAMPEYYLNYKPLAEGMRVPVLYYYGKKDYAVGTNHHEDVHFPNMTRIGWDGGHVPFMEGKEELERAIASWLAIFNS